MEYIYIYDDRLPGRPRPITVLAAYCVSIIVDIIQIKRRKREKHNISYMK